MLLEKMSLGKLNCVIIVLVTYFLSQNAHSELQVGFYSYSCDMAEFIVKDEVTKSYNRNPGIAAGLGCDASVLLDSTPSNTAEKDSPANKPSLRGFEVIDNAKAKLEEVCQGIVSCADIIAFAARDSVELAQGLGYDVPAGRRDGRISLVSDTRTDLPPPTFNVNQLTQLFAKKGLSQEEMVTLSGAHTIGRSHCSAFSNRLYNFSATSRQDPSLDPSYASFLKRQCPQGNTNQNLVVPMDPSSPGTIDAGYYNDILANRALFTSDQTLLTNTETASLVNENARDPYQWASKLADAMVKMGQIGALTGNAGEVRTNCRVVNSYQ
ncbi:unnamed protein product [Lupinus luteus]|uniref:Peroxidase n=1 Tax=Lupinus luteus TaxID=3873 RepID=A0AAV1XE46_LUPLU